VSSLVTNAVAEQVLPAIHETAADDMTFVGKSFGPRALAGLCLLLGSHLEEDGALAVGC